MMNLNSESQSNLMVKHTTNEYFANCTLQIVMCAFYVYNLNFYDRQSFIQIESYVPMHSGLFCILAACSFTKISYFKVVSNFLAKVVKYQVKTVKFEATMVNFLTKMIKFLTKNYQISNKIVEFQVKIVKFDLNKSQISIKSCQISIKSCQSLIKTCLNEL